MTNRIREQILAVRETGLTDMFDIYGVQRVAYSNGLHNLVLYLDDRDNRSEYIRFMVSDSTNTREE